MPKSLLKTNEKGPIEKARTTGANALLAVLQKKFVLSGCQAYISFPR